MLADSLRRRRPGGDDRQLCGRRTHAPATATNVFELGGVGLPPPPTPPTPHPDADAHSRAGCRCNTAPALGVGDPEPGHALTCSTGTWSNSPTGFAYQWDRAGKAIAGATASRYTVQIGDEAQNLACTVTASNAQGAGVPATSAAVLVALPGTRRAVPSPPGRLRGARWVRSSWVCHARGTPQAQALWRDPQRLRQLLPVRRLGNPRRVSVGQAAALAVQAEAQARHRDHPAADGESVLRTGPDRARGQAHEELPTGCTSARRFMSAPTSGTSRRARAPTGCSRCGGRHPGGGRSPTSGCCRAGGRSLRFLKSFSGT